MIRIQVNRTTCQGYGNCVLAAESVFDLDDDGLVLLRQQTIADDQLDAVRQAAYGCPTDSITITETEDLP
jgi:ferredoxin